MGRTVLGVCLLVFLISGRCKTENQAVEPTTKESTPDLIEINKAMVDIEKDRIDGYIKRRGLKMEESGTGLRYAVRNGEGEPGNPAKSGDRVLIDYSVSLLDGTVCYNSPEEGEVIKIGMDNIESGVHEGLTYLKEGQQGLFILPPHLAHGLIGDQNKIPGNATIIYSIDLKRIL